MNTSASTAEDLSQEGRGQAAGAVRLGGVTIMLRQRAIAVAAVLLALFGVTVACGAGAGPAAIAWTDCHDGRQCARISVPADWRSPESSGTVTIGLGRFPVKDPATRVGTLLLGPGGPNPVLFALPRLQPQIGELTRWFDVVVFDPRGMGESSGVSCPSAPPPVPTWTEPDRAAYDRYAAAQRRFADECAAALGPLQGRIDAWQVAHDMDAIRAALGEPTLNYFGNSYGTVYGQAYAELFGARVGRMVLDSVVDHTTDDVYDVLAPKAVALERNLHEFAAWCARTPACSLHGRDALAVWDEAAAGPQGTAVISGTAVAVRRPNRWPQLAAALAAGDPGSLAPPAASPGRDGGAVPGGYLLGLATCADLPDVDYAALTGITERLRATTPRIGWTEAFGTHGRCAGLPGGTYPPRPLPAQDLPPILVTGGDSDSATPPEFGRRIADRLGARYLAAAGGHSRYLGGDECVRRIVDRYLASGELPAPDVRCPS
jgi:pimeloyl-ACP methyl ester carboxylesterase